MRLLLDTHAVLWWLADDVQLGAQARELIANPDHDVLVSVVSLWEIAVKRRVGKLDADVSRILGLIEESGFIRLAITDSHLSALSGLPMHHRDPFDHLLIAQAIVEDAVFMSEDRSTKLYQVRSLSCSGGSDGVS